MFCKCLEVIRSCETKEQLRVATKLVILTIPYLDTKVYLLLVNYLGKQKAELMARHDIYDKGNLAEMD